jgi:hypothetical protein
MLVLVSMSVFSGVCVSALFLFLDVFLCNSFWFHLGSLALMTQFCLMFGHCDPMFHPSVPEETLRRLRLVFDGIVRLDAPPSPTADPAALQARLGQRDAGDFRSMPYQTKNSMNFP